MNQLVKSILILLVTSIFQSQLMASETCAEDYSKEAGELRKVEGYSCDISILNSEMASMILENAKKLKKLTSENFCLHNVSYYLSPEKIIEASNGTQKKQTDTYYLLTAVECSPKHGNFSDPTFGGPGEVRHILLIRSFRSENISHGAYSRIYGISKVWTDQEMILDIKEAIKTHPITMEKDQN